MPDSMTVRLHLYRIRVIEVAVDLPERLEGTSNKLGVLKRIAYGFVNTDNFAARA